MTATTFGIDTSEANSANNMIAYCWHSVPGYNFLIGEYVGNVTSHYVHCGFKPALVIMKSHGSGGWMIWDNKRETQNPQTLRLELQTTSVQSSHSNYTRDTLSNGFRLRTTSLSGMVVVLAMYSWHLLKIPLSTPRVIKISNI